MWHRAQVEDKGQRRNILQRDIVMVCTLRCSADRRCEALTNNAIPSLRERVSPWSASHPKSLMSTKTPAWVIYSTGTRSRDAIGAHLR